MLLLRAYVGNNGESRRKRMFSLFHSWFLPRLRSDPAAGSATVLLYRAYTMERREEVKPCQDNGTATRKALSSYEPAQAGKQKNRRGIASLAHREQEMMKTPMRGKRGNRIQARSGTIDPLAGRQRNFHRSPRRLLTTAVLTLDG